MSSWTFSGSTRHALADAAFLRARLPDAQRRGKELVAGDLHGHPGRSFSLNTDTGVWSDFATGESGGDVTALVAAQEGLTQGQAGKLIAETLGVAPDVRPSKQRTGTGSSGSSRKLACHVRVSR